MKSDFPIFSRYPDLVYLDSACTSLKPRQVLEAEMSYYTEYGACAGRSSHFLGRKTNEMLDKCREKIAKFVNGKNIVFTKNATEAINIVINGFDFSKRRKVVTSVMEHHAVLLPLMRLNDRGIIDLRVLQCNEYGEVEWEIDRETALVVTNNANNTTGYFQNVKEIAKMAHDNGAKICIDGAQGVPHKKVDVKKEGLDFLCFSGHKMLGPTGTGALAVNDLGELDSFIVGGGTVKTVRLDRVEHLDDHTRFEAGIQDYGGIFGFAAACDYLNNKGMGNIEEHERKMASLLGKALEGIATYGRRHDTALYSFNLGNRPHDVALMLDKDRIAVRSGFFCAQPGMEAMGAKNGAVRASCYIYNNEEDIKKFSESMEKIKMLY